MPPEYPEKNSWRNYLAEKTLPWLRRYEEEIIFHVSRPQPKIRPPAQYASLGYAALPEFKEEQLQVSISGKAPETLGLWVRKPDDETKPVYVVFHGRKGTWAAAGFVGEYEKLGLDKHFRLGWLDAIAQTGAGVIAVHTPGHGLSRGSYKRVGEQAFRDDIDALADYLVDERGIDSGRLIITGESLGGAMAAMLAEKLTRKGHPPAMLGLINSFSRFADAAANSLRTDGYLLPSLSATELREHPDAQAICEHHSDMLHQHLKSKFETSKRIGTLDPDRTRIYLANNPDDLDVPFDQHAKLREAAEARGLQMTTRILEGAECLTSQPNAHINWNPALVVRDMEALYHTPPQPPVDRHTRNINPGDRGHSR